MKTTKLIFALSLGLIFAAGFNNMYAQEPLNIEKPDVKLTKKIVYVVKIENASQLSVSGARYLVQMTDGTGKLIAPAQSFRPGISTYIFYERTTWKIRGTRAASIMQLSSETTTFNMHPSAITGTFFGGVKYQFTIKPTPVIITKEIGEN